MAESAGYYQRRYLYRCTRGHFIEHWAQWSRDVDHVRCTEPVERLRTSGVAPISHKVKGPCGCKFARVKTRALCAAYALGGLQAVLELEARTP